MEQLLGVRDGKTFAFSTKAVTLERLRSRLTRSEIPDFTYFSIAQWKADPEGVLARIRELGSTVVVRSSALNEDSSTSSLAGRYESILDVDASSDEALCAAIERVRGSYAKDGHNDENQILAQRQVGDVQLSGVIFTRDLETGAPYYIINYDDHSGRTDIITSGSGSQQKIFTYCKLYDQRPSDEYLAQLIDAVREIEEATSNDALDIEFVISQDRIHTLQVRPITTIRGKPPVEDLKETLDNIKQFFRESNRPYPNLAGRSVAYGIMPDWNPAEIIGVEPKPLAFSLYRHLITDNVWPLSRQLVGYRNVGHQPGICSLGGRPYVDIRMSFNTFLPASLSRMTAEKLVDFYIMKLRRFQDLHDKVEFKVVYTCYQFDYEEIEREMHENGFFASEIKELKHALKELTGNILSEQVTSIEEEMRQTQILAVRREGIVKSDIPLLTKIAQLCHDCKVYGTLPFAKLARFAFISSALMRSLLRKGILSREEYDAFFSSIQTVATEFLYALGEVKRGEMSREEFIAGYGHLRPGTYDICSRTYAESFDEYIDLERFVPPHPQRPFTLPRQTVERIGAELASNGFSVSAEDFLTFVRKSTAAREKAKFEFTKNLSLVLQYTEEHFQARISREDMAFLTIDDILELASTSLWHDSIAVLKHRIARNKERYVMTKLIKLPPVIFLEKSVEYFRSTDMMPNFITQRTVCAEVVCINGKEEMDLTGKIVLIENADPGYDWIFSHSIAGLITEFGGANSHMTIRAAEFKLPAAIGCGATLYNFVKSCKRVELNCAAKQIKAVL